jgi:DmsE family decaheme c-type cytochrome
MKRLRNLLAALLLCVGGLAAPAAALAGVDPEGTKACVECHDSEDLADSSRHAHSHPTDARAPGCTSCHGTSERHLKNPEKSKDRPRPDITYGKKGASPVAVRNATCHGCHSKDQKRMLWAGSPHEAADVACNSCHRNHTNEDRALARASEAELCYACHKEQRTQLARPSHHPIPEGKMGCSDCHNVHGSAGPKLAKRDSTNDTCYSCHAEKRGPFVHPHEPATQDCASCHNPHGSTVQAMLKARPPMLCMQCHTPHVAGNVGAVGGQPGVFTPPRPGVAPAVGPNTNGRNVVNIWQGRSCTNCHTQTHGSNNPAATNPTPNFLFR